MPVYDIACDSAQECGHFEDVVISLRDLDTAGCPACGGPIRRLPRPVRTVGPMPSNPLTIKQIGRSFESAGELRQYQKENPDVQILSPDSKKWRDKVSGVREKANQRAKNQGYRDLEDKQAKRWNKTPDGRSIKSA